MRVAAGWRLAGGALLAAYIAAAGCVATSSTEGPLGAQNDGDGAACWPSSAATLADGSSTGCAPEPTFPVCQVPSGSIVLADGATVAPDGAPAPAECRDACGVDEYALSCENAAPDTALHCTVVPVPTPSTTLFYCCPCPTASP
jgi:hypothetical protein